MAQRNTNNIVRAALVISLYFLVLRSLMIVFSIVACQRRIPLLHTYKLICAGILYNVAAVYSVWESNLQGLSCHGPSLIKTEQLQIIQFKHNAIMLKIPFVLVQVSIKPHLYVKHYQYPIFAYNDPFFNERLMNRRCNKKEFLLSGKYILKNGKFYDFNSRLKFRIKVEAEFYLYFASLIGQQRTTAHMQQ